MNNNIPFISGRITRKKFWINFLCGLMVSAALIAIPAVLGASFSMHQSVVLERLAPVPNNGFSTYTQLGDISVTHKNEDGSEYTVAIKRAGEEFTPEMQQKMLQLEAMATDIPLEQAPPPVVVTAAKSNASPFGKFLYLAGIFVFLGTIIITPVQRLHDRGRAGWWSLVSCTPFIGIIGFIWIMIECGFLGGEDKPNRYGPVLV